MFCSTIIPTIGRDSLNRAVMSVLSQESDGFDFEVIVVNDSGQALCHQDWHEAPNVRIISTNRRERSVARNVGAAISRGKYLHFLDDDDIILPGALMQFWQTACRCDDLWLYGSYQTVDNDGRLVEVIHPEESGDIFGLTIVGESIPFQCSLLSADAFHEVGMFSADPDIIGVEDRDVGRRLAFLGTVTYLPDVVAEIRIGESNSSTDWAKIASRDQWGRERALNIEGAYARARNYVDSAYTSGRLARALIASSYWNLKRRRFARAFSRACACLLPTNIRILSPYFWRGFFNRPQPQ